MPNPDAFSIKVPWQKPKSDQENQENWRSVIDWDRRLAATGRTLLGFKKILTATNLVTFSSIPQTYNHLIVVCNVAGDQATQQQLFARFNNDSGANYWWEVIATINGAAPQTFNAAAQNQQRFGNVSDSGANRTAINENRIIDYSKPTFALQGFIQSSCQANASTQRYSGGWFWNSAVPVNLISIFPQAGNFNPGSTFYLYGEY